jgi:nitrate reductase (cytochrome), electron transfer subunit
VLRRADIFTCYRHFLGGLAPRRYACIACHVPQTTARPLVENRFTDLDALVETERRER